MNKKNKRIIIWTKNIDSLLSGKGKVGGITVQMSFWAKTFHKNGWQVYSFSEKDSSKMRGIKFLKFPTKKYIGIFIELFLSLYYIARLRPDVIFFRGASRSVFYLSIYAKILRSKLVFLGASDTDFQKEKELIKAKHDKIMYRYGLHCVDYFIVQNTFQKEALYTNYSKSESVIIPNIWGKPSSESDFHFDYTEYVLWVSNFRKLKRPEWFTEIAKYFPSKQFVMVGGPVNYESYNNCKIEAERITNLSFLGPRKLNEVEALFKRASLFVCTSTVEGFPNTFLQAWANSIPVISTVDPSGLITENKLGITIETQKELVAAVKDLETSNLYSEIQQNIDEYFAATHSPQSNYQKLLQFVKVGA